MHKVVSHWPCIAKLAVSSRTRRTSIILCSLAQFEALNLLDFRDPQSRAGVEPAGISVRSLPVG